jgi:hypothetical protein
MIIILRRKDLPRTSISKHPEKLRLDDLGLSNEMIEQADLVVFMEGNYICFLKCRMPSPPRTEHHNLDRLVGMVIGYAPAPPSLEPADYPPFRRQKPWG